MFRKRGVPVSVYERWLGGEFAMSESTFRKQRVPVSVYERWLGGELTMSESQFRKQRVTVSKAGSPCFGL